jgi:hypothetical protein
LCDFIIFVKDASMSLPPDLRMERYKIELSRWFNEDALVNQRLTWLLASQALLFAAYGGIASKVLAVTCATEVMAATLLSVIPIITWIGRSFAVVILAGIVAAIMAQLHLHRTWTPRPAQLGVSTPTTLIGWGTCVLVPIIFLGAWCWLPSLQIDSSKCDAVHASAVTPASATGTPAAPAQAR